MNSQPFYVNCPCQHCGGHIEFDASGFQKGETQKINCPHCGLETMIFVPPTLDKKQSLPSKSPIASRAGKFPVALVAVSVACVFFMVATFFLLRNNRVKEKGQSIDEIFFSGHKAPALQPWPPPIANRMEFTQKLLENFHERVDRQLGWMDGNFIEIDNYPIESYMGSMYLGVSTAFTMEDKDGKMFQFCLADKNKFGDLLLKLHRDDRIRVTGQAVSMGTSVMWISIDSIQIVK